MTKLGEWLFGLTIFLGIYTAIVTEQVKSVFLEEWMFEIQILPIFLVLMLGVSILMDFQKFPSNTRHPNPISRFISFPDPQKLINIS